MSFLVDLSLLDELVRRMATFERQLDTVQADVDVRMQRVHGVWTGVAAIESAEAHARWATGAREMHEALAVLRSIAATARANYSSAIEANARMWALR